MGRGVNYFVTKDVFDAQIQLSRLIQKLLSAGNPRHNACCTRSLRFGPPSSHPQSIPVNHRDPRVIYICEYLNHLERKRINSHYPE